MAENPMAGVSGPSVYSKRTDIGTPEMKMGSIAYGEGVETQALKSGAPLGKTPDAVAEPQDRLRPVSAAPVTELFAPTQRPDEPITAGVDIGEGPGSSALIMQSRFAERKMSDILAEMIPFDTTGEIVILYQNALARGN
jgi:hypothetical protein